MSYTPLRPTRRGLIKSTAALLCGALASTLLPSAIPAAHAESVSVKSLHQFAPQYNDGAGGRAELIVGSDGNFYGTTVGGGVQDNGTIFRITPAGKLSVLHNFTAVDNFGTNADGAAPRGSLVLGNDGFFYGTTQQGGNNGNGVVFKIARTTGVLTVLHHFGSKDANGLNADGAKPASTLVQGNDDAFYGTAPQGGNGASGTVFKVTSDGTFANLHNFTARSAGNHNFEGAVPFAGLLLASDGYFYGTTTSGGSNGNGVVFKFLPGSSFTPLRSFSALDKNSHNTDGVTPYAALIEGEAGSFYGTAIGGGQLGNGTVFQILANGTLTTLHSFSAKDNMGVNADGAAPFARLLLDNGDLYGTTTGGGAHGVGAIYELPTDGSTFSTLHSFDAPFNDGANDEGGAPYGGLVEGGNGQFYGVTSARGGELHGTIYSYDPFNKELTNLHNFQPSINRGGAHSHAPLLRASDGNFYGMATDGGANGHGTIFKVAADGSLTILHSFSPVDPSSINGDGISPTGALVEGSNGDLYGVAAAGGSFGHGTAFKITPAGKLTVLHNFGFGAENGGSAPFAGMIRGNDGNFYGTCSQGGATGNGTVYRLTPAGTLTTLHDFTDLTSGISNGDGSSPGAELLLGHDGNLYGTAFYGGTSGSGTVFKMTLGGAFTVIHQFSALNADTNSEGAGPSAALIQGTDGNFYGTATYGGNNGYGTVFVIASNNDFAVVHTFSAPDNNDVNTDGFFPSAPLLQGQDGYFYGTANRGGANGFGTIFRVTSLGGFDTLHSFALAEGTLPQAALIQDNKGTFYGTTDRGGTGNNGSLFTMVLPPVINSATSASAAAGQPFSYQITATNGPTAYGVLGLPPGLTVNAKTGLISGTPTTGGKKTLTLKVVNRAGGDTQTLTLDIASGAPVITSALSAEAHLGQPFSYQITATNGPTSYAVGNLRPGLTLNKTTGLITGKPTGGEGAYLLKLKATNAYGTGIATLTLNVKSN